MLTVLFIGGCGSRSDLVSVTGTVLVDGAPATSGTVSFVPEDGMGNSATGIIDESGQFVMSTHEVGDGVEPGTYKVGISIWKTPAGGDEATGQLIPPTPLLPQEYMNPQESGLTATVTPTRAQTVQFEVSADG